MTMKTKSAELQKNLEELRAKMCALVALNNPESKSGVVTPEMLFCHAEILIILSQVSERHTRRITAMIWVAMVLSFVYLACMLG